MQDDLNPTAKPDIILKECEGICPTWCRGERQNHWMYLVKETGEYAPAPFLSMSCDGDIRGKHSSIYYFGNVGVD